MIPIMLKELNQLNSAEIGLVMFPGAMSAAVMGTVTGRIADKKGSVPVVYAGLFLLITGYFLLSTFAGAFSIAITFILLLIYVGFSCIQSSMANTVSQILPKELTGVGMGLYNLVFFISAAFLSSITGKILDFTDISFKINPFSMQTFTPIFSNVGIGLILLTSAALFIFNRTFRSHSRMSQ